MNTPNNVLWQAAALAEMIKYKGHLPYNDKLNKVLVITLDSYVRSDKRQPQLMALSNRLLLNYLNECTLPYRKNLKASTPAQMRMSALAMVITEMQHIIDNMSDREVDSALRALMIPKINLTDEEFVHFVNNTESRAFSTIIDTFHEIRDAEKNQAE